ncbi:MAG TPA: outer membrane beta-barrel protein [Steroidobacteraceae bacterium]|nr:outer membrane beta-barrel protein [Steroidobacteraceae bacterium]
MRAAIIVIVMLAGSFAAGPGRAAPLGIYAGAGYAMVDKDADRAVFVNEAVAIYNAFGFDPQNQTGRFDPKDSAYGFVVGWRLTEHLALEGGYIDLGDVTYRDTSTGLFAETPPPETWQQNIDSGTSGVALSALGILPLSYRWEVFGRGGLLLSNSTESVFITDRVGSEKLRASKSGVDFLAGVGISMSLVEIYSVRLEYMRVFDAGEDDTLNPADVDVLSLNVTVSF